MGSSDGSFLVFGVFLLLIGVAALVPVAIDASTYSDRVESAVATEGRIVEEPRYYESGDDDVTQYTVRVKYRYSVADRSYTGSTVWPDGSNTFSSVDRVDGFVRNHSANSTVTVYYQPSNPERSFLRKGSVGLVMAHNPVLTASGVGGTLFALVTMAVGLWRWRRDS